MDHGQEFRRHRVVWPVAGDARRRAAWSPRITHSGPLEWPRDAGLAHRPAHLQRSSVDCNDPCRDDSEARRCDHHRHAGWRRSGAQTTRLHEGWRCLRSGDRGPRCLDQPRAKRLRKQNGATPVQYSDYKCFQFSFDSGVAFVSINHPPINLLDETLSLEFDKLGRDLEADDRGRVGVVQSALPDFFIAHSGLGRVGAAAKVVSHTRIFRLTQMIGERFRNMNKATIAKVEGRARGGGSELALAMDMCFAAVDEAIFCQPEVAIGLVPGGGSTQRLPRLMGRGRALEVLLGCNDLSAELAERYGY